ncbi:phosphatidylethanolamine-binding protein 4 isoform X2 [Acanthochromis polyacanthus]|uniref:phosphatidylethanolamine-binding protein 4 isoform X2 n=1 Tax=Acanthochromis polyacanthus TaxID=80966 RepID=UPI002233FF8A|nr:phosphatidylethanolamine-binding protein 4 isoform X2 [Acanthochromis polyacanthus]
MAGLAPFVVLCVFILGATQQTLNTQDASFCHGGLEVIYPELDIDKCLIIPKDRNLREKVSTVWKAPQIYFSRAQQGKALKNGRIQGTTLTDYLPPTPPHNTGLHRYQFMLFEQPADAQVSLTKQEKSSRGKWDFQAFVKRFDLGEPVAAVQFLTQNYKD